MAKLNLTEEQKEVFKLVKIILIVLVLLAIVYLGSRLFITKDLFKDKDKETETTEPIEATFNYSKTIIGEMLSRPYDNYYVMMYDTTADDAASNQSMIMAYKGTKKIFNVDLNDGFNTKYIGKESSKDATSLENFKVKGLTLIEVKKGSIVKYLDASDEIITELGLK